MVSVSKADTAGVAPEPELRFYDYMYNYHVAHTATEREWVQVGRERRTRKLHRHCS